MTSPFPRLFASGLLTALLLCSTLAFATAPGVAGFHDGLSSFSFSMDLPSLAPDFDRAQLVLDEAAIDAGVLVAPRNPASRAAVSPLALIESGIVDQTLSLHALDLTPSDGIYDNSRREVEATAVDTDADGLSMWRAQLANYWASTAPDWDAPIYHASTARASVWSSSTLYNAGGRSAVGSTAHAGA